MQPRAGSETAPTSLVSSPRQGSASLNVPPLHMLNFAKLPGEMKNEESEI